MIQTSILHHCQERQNQHLLAVALAVEATLFVVPTQVFALITGLVQGVACSTNPQGAVLPVVSQLHNDKSVAATYLIALCVTCTCVMGILAALYGAFSRSGGGSKQQQGSSNNKCNRICLSLVEDVPACLSKPWEYRGWYS